ncbi:MAG: PEP-CTERM system TPR-repeat protein PrsT [Hahellaceae bacterium]|nr:PEP-CTERM system TPR-repeat protein PrsT [Hahellaceae bacterium]
MPLRRYLAVPLFISLFACSSWSLAETAANQQDVASHYEAALKAFNEGHPNDAFVHLKNALQQNPVHLPSKLLMSQVYFDAGNLAAVEDELVEALALGADINLVLPMLGNALVMQKKVDRLMALEKRYSEFTPQNRFEWSLLKGQAFIIEQNTSRAQAEFEKAAAMFPEDPRALNTLATLYLGLGMVEKAQALVDTSLALDVKNERTWTLNGELALAKHNLTLARAHFEQAFALDAKDPKVLRQLVLVNLQQQRVEEARRYLEIITRNEPEDPTATLISAWLLASEDQMDLARQSLADLSAKLSVIDTAAMKNAQYLLFIQGASDYLQGNLEKARSRLSAYLDKKPGDPGALRMLLDIYLKSDETLRAIELLERNERSIEQDLQMSAQLVLLYLESSKLLSAEQLLRKMKASFADHPYLVLLEARILKARNRPEEALNLLDNLKLGSAAPFSYLLLRGELQLTLNQPAAAEKTAQLLIAQHPEHPDVLNFVAAVYIHNQRMNDALAVIDQILVSNPTNENALFNRAIVLQAQGDHDGSTRLLKQILNETPRHTSSLLLLARHAAQLKQYEDALQWLNKVLVYDLQNIGAREQKLDVLMQMEDWPEALRVVKDLTALDRVNPQYLMQTASILIRMERYDDAHQPLSVLFGIWYESPAQLQQLARLQVAAKDIVSAEKSLNKAIELDSTEASLPLDLARLQFIKGDMAAAARQLKRIEDRFGHSTSTYLLAGDIAVAQGDLISGQKNYTRALDSDAQNHLALVNFYQLTQQGVGGAEFTQLVERLMKKGTQPEWVAKLLADSYLNQGQWDKAQQAYEALLSTPAFSRNSDIFNNLANLYARTDLEKALLTAQEGMALNRHSPALLDTLGWILVKKGDYANALPYLREAFAMDSASAETRYHLGYTLWKLDRVKEAISELTLAVGKGNKFPEVDDARALLKQLSP